MHDSVIQFLGQLDILTFDIFEHGFDQFQIYIEGQAAARLEVEGWGQFELARLPHRHSGQLPGFGGAGGFLRLAVFFSFNMVGEDIFQVGGGI